MIDKKILIKNMNKKGILIKEIHIFLEFKLLNFFLIFILILENSIIIFKKGSCDIQNH